MTPIIYIVEDDDNIREELKLLLNTSGYEVRTTTDYKNAVDDILNVNPDMVLLDVNLEGISGLTICDRLRDKSDVPIIFVTGNNTSMDELNCIIRGGDDYISKPYQPPILLARIAALLKRTKKSTDKKSDTILECGNVRLDTSVALIYKDNKKAELTKNEMKILYYLFANKGKIISREELIDYLWDNDVFIDDNALSVNVTRIRNKLKELDEEKLIQTKRGMGYICG
ncbi:MAG: response regulator transcription factor [Lachnospiraceae bacterium]|nr:response regulator transcription factor [Lachnospiraceae bacterium]